jgi:hypothetical protein
VGYEWNHIYQAVTGMQAKNWEKWKSWAGAPTGPHGEGARRAGAIYCNEYGKIF